MDLRNQLATAQSQAASDTGPQITGFESVAKPGEVDPTRAAEVQDLYQQGFSEGMSSTEIAAKYGISDYEAEDYIQRQEQERTMRALSGDLPVDPALEHSFEQQQSQLEETLRKRLGPDWETSTPGMEAMDIFSRRKEDLLESFRTGQLTTSQALEQGRAGFQQQTMGQTFSTMSGLSGYPYQGVNYLGTAQGYGNLAALMQQDRWNTANYQMNAAQMQASSNASSGALMGDIVNTCGQAAGMLGGALLI